MAQRAHALLTSLTLVTGGTLLAISFLLAESSFLVPLAMAILVLGVVALSVGHAIETQPGPLALLMPRCHQDTVAQLLRSHGDCDTAVYLPSNLRQGNPVAALRRCRYATPPLPGEQVLSSHRQSSEKTEPVLLIPTPCSYCMEMIEGPVDATVDDAATALKTLACGSLNAAQDVRVSKTGDNLRVTFTKHRCSTSQVNPLVAAHLGSPLASIAAVVLSEALRQPLQFRQETCEKDDLVVFFTIEECSGP